MKPAEKAQLENLAMHAADISAAMTYFLDHFAEDESFLSAGAPCHLPELEPILAASLRSVVGEHPITDLLAVRVEGEAFVHGGCRVKGLMAMFFYFESTRVGVVGTTDRTGKSHFVRFRTSVTLPSPSRN